MKADEALYLWATGRGEAQPLLVRFYPFGEDAHVQRFRKFDDCGEERVGLLVVPKRGYERAVNLDFVDRKLRQVAQA
jgi:hypothetical protein